MGVELALNKINSENGKLRDATATRQSPKIKQNTQQRYKGPMMECTKYDLNGLKNAPEELRNDNKFMSQIVKRNAEALKWIGEGLNGNKAFILECMKEHNGMTLEHASSKWKDDEDVVLVAVDKKYGYGPSSSPLQFASDRLRNDKDFVMQCVKLESTSLQYASEQLRHDREYIMSVVKVKGLTLQYVPHFQNDIEIVTVAVMQDGHALQYASDELKNDKVIVMNAVMQHGWSLEFASKQLQNDKHVVTSAVMQRGSSLEFASNELKNDKDIVLAAVKRDGFALKQASDRLKRDEYVVLSAIKNYSPALVHASDSLRYNVDLLITVCCRETSAKLKNGEKDL